MPFLLDTSTCSTHLKLGDNTPIFTKMVQYGGQLFVSRLTVAELYAFAFRGNARRVEQFDQFFNDVHIADFSLECAREYGKLHAFLAERQISLGAIDLMLAATAKVNSMTLVTHDADFDALGKLGIGFDIVDWL